MNYKSLFSLPENIHYLNCAYMSPLLKSVEEAGKRGIERKRNPIDVSPASFFTEVELLKAKFAQLVNAKASQVAIIPSVSYGMASALKNIPGAKGMKAITISEEFPSDVFSLHRFCADTGASLQTIHPPTLLGGRGQRWNTELLEAIDENTAVVAISVVHWADGTLFDLEAIGKRCREVNAYFLVDGTQSVGARAIDVEKFGIDALVCAGYKWLMGPYSMGLAYYSEKFDGGVPIEESWMNRKDSDKFSELTNYQTEYRGGASRYNVGESSNFILVPMMIRALEQILEWSPNLVESYTSKLNQPLLDFLNENGFWLEEDGFRASHLFGFGLPQGINPNILIQTLAAKNIYLSLRSNAIRVSPHLYNNETDIAALIDELRNALK
jgi:selenocysteine lyase/cysteine desulfurase